jgi:1-acyl-sn-glycerol-3-phosphate acyltransferase
MSVVYLATWWAVRAAARLWFRWEVHFPERVPIAGPVILAANHTSFADPPLMGGAVHRPLNFLARDTLFQSAIFGWYIRTMQAVPVNRDGAGGAGLKAILDRLSAGGCILLFPEGTRSADGRLLAAKSGIGLTVIKSDAPVVPVRILGAFEAWGRHLTLPRPRKIRIVFGEPMPFARHREEARTADKAGVKRIYQEVADEIMAAIAGLEAPKT